MKTKGKTKVGSKHTGGRRGAKSTENSTRLGKHHPLKSFVGTWIPIEQKAYLIYFAEARKGSQADYIERAIAKAIESDKKQLGAPSTKSMWPYRRRAERGTQPY